MLKASCSYRQLDEMKGCVERYVGAVEWCQSTTGALQLRKRVGRDAKSCMLCMQGMDDAKLIYQAVPAGLAGRRFAPPAAAMCVAYILRNRMRFSVTSSFVSGTSGSGDSGHSSGLLFPAKIGHLLRLPTRSSSVRTFLLITAPLIAFSWTSEVAPRFRVSLAYIVYLDCLESIGLCLVGRVNFQFKSRITAWCNEIAALHL